MKTINPLPNDEAVMAADDEKFQRYCEQGFKLFQRKNRQYGGAYKYMGLIGTVSEISGIAMRLVVLVFRNFDNIADHTDEILDCLLDLHNYANMSMVCIADNNYYGKILGD